MTEASSSPRLSETRQVAISRVTQARAKLLPLVAQAEEIRQHPALPVWRKNNELEEVHKDGLRIARAFTLQAREFLRSGQGSGTAQEWSRSLTAPEAAERDAIAAYLDSAQVVLDVEAKKLRPSGGPTAGELTARDTEAAKLATFEALKTVSPGVGGAQGRWD